MKQINRRRQRAAVSFGLLRPMRVTGENTCFRGTPPPKQRWWRLATNTCRTFFLQENVYCGNDVPKHAVPEHAMVPPNLDFHLHNAVATTIACT